MYIKSIVLDGFKSYGQRTEINGFDPQFNAITGLNGSGKSNILDSICFVLGISNLNHVRAGSLQDLIYKSGQAGINQATVTICFDNQDPSQCPPGFERYEEITVSRQIVMGGKNKYMINGSVVPNKRVQDLFCSVQLNVNNPHFLIMQGKITKVLNMKAVEILAMVEEAAGTRMYEIKRQHAQKLIEKKEAKLEELRSILNEEVEPKMRKLRQDREQYMEYQNVLRELEKYNGLYQCWQYVLSRNAVKDCQDRLTNVKNKIVTYESQIQQNIELSAKLDEDIKEIESNANTEHSEKLKQLDAELKAKQLVEAKSTASQKSIKDNVNAENRKLKQLQKNLDDDRKTVEKKEKELSKFQSMFETLKQNDEEDNKAFMLSQKKFEAASTGMEINEDGKAQTLQEQLMAANEEAVNAATESKQASLQLTACQSELAQKEKEVGANTTDYETEKKILKSKEKEVTNLESRINKLNYSEERMTDLQKQRRALTDEIGSLQDRVDIFYSRRPFTKFRYTDPEPNFNRNSVKGVVCNLIKFHDKKDCMALETASGGKLYNVIIDTELTGTKLLKYGKLERRTTFIPLNKTKASATPEATIRFAQDLVGADNCRHALSLIKYDPNYKIAMQLVFGHLFVCKDLNIAKQVAFHPRIKTKCVTLDGDVVDPAGVLSGGSPVEGGTMFYQLWETQKNESILETKQKELEAANRELHKLNAVQEEYNSVKQKLDLARFEKNLSEQKLQQTSYHIQQEEINNLRTRIEELQKKMKTCKEQEKKSKEKAKELESKLKDAKGYKEKQLKQAENEMMLMKQKAEKSRKEWKEREQQYEVLNLEISELKKGLENIQTEMETCQNAILALNTELEGMAGGAQGIKEEVAKLQNEVKSIKGLISQNKSEINQKNKEKENLLAKNNNIQLKIKEQSHELKELENKYNSAKSKEKELYKRVEGNSNITTAEGLSSADGVALENKVKHHQIKKQTLSRTVNTKAQSMLDEQEKQYTELTKKQKIVEQDKKKILVTITDMDKQKEKSLKLAYEQVSKDFGSIFGTLLPGANAKLVAPNGKTILEGLEIKVSLGGVWKENLTELSGGQRSLAALSLILAMLLFKPAPLYILDEVDAALDLSHTQNIGSMLKSHFKQSQFLIVSLKDGMFNNANVLFRTKFVDGVSAISRTVNTKVVGGVLNNSRTNRH